MVFFFFSIDSIDSIFSREAIYSILSIEAGFPI